LSELGTSHDFLRCPRVFLGLLGPGTRDCQSLGHPVISRDVPSYGNHLSQVQVEYQHPGTLRDIPRCPGVFLGLLGPGTSDSQGLGHPWISRDVPGSWDYLDLGQEIARGHPGISQDVPSYGNHFSQVQVEYPGTSRDIPRCPREFGPGTRDCQSLGHPWMSRDVPGSWDYLDLGQEITRAWDIPGYPKMSQAMAITCPRSK